MSAFNGMPRRKRPLSPDSEVLHCSVPGCRFTTTSLLGIRVHKTACYRKLGRQVQAAAQGTAGQGAGTRQRSGQVRPRTEAADGAGVLEVARLGTLPAQLVDATARAAIDVATAPAAPLVPPEPRELAPAVTRAARSTLPPQARSALGQQGDHQAVQWPWPPAWAPKLSDGGSLADCGPVPCREQPAVQRQPPRPVLTPLQLELFEGVQQLPESEQTEVLRVVDDMVRMNVRVGFRTARAFKAAMDAQQVSPFDAAPARDNITTYLLFACWSCTCEGLRIGMGLGNARAGLPGACVHTRPISAHLHRLQCRVQLKPGRPLKSALPGTPPSTAPHEMAGVADRAQTTLLPCCCCCRVRHQPGTRGHRSRNIAWQDVV